MAFSWLVFTEIEGSVVLSLAESLEEATEKAAKELRPRGSVRPGASGVILLDHALRAAQVQSYSRAGHEMVYNIHHLSERPPMIAAAYDGLYSGGYDAERDLAAGIQPSPDKVKFFIQRLNIPVHLHSRVESPSITEKVVKKGINPLYIAVGAGALALILLMVFLLGKH